MKRLQDPLYSGMGEDGNLQEEKRSIYEQFKFSSGRARRLAVENNRRRRALEERQKLWDIEEEQMRQKIIQQRKQRINNATQRFQRSHLPHPPPTPPPPQRYMQVPRINVPTVEEALVNIQSKLDSCNFQSSVSTSNYTKSRTHPSSPNPIKPQSCCHESLTAVEAISQLLPVRSKTGIINHQVPGEQQNYSPQDSHPSDHCDSESLSSKDSLENADPKSETKKTLSRSHLCPPFVSQKTRAGPASFTEIILLGDNLSNSGKLSSYQQEKQEAVEDFNIKKTHAAAFQEERQKQMGWKKHHQKPPTELTGAINNFSKILNSNCKTEKLNMATSVKQAFLNNSQSDTLKYPQQPEEGGQKLSFSPHPGKKVTFNKGVLKSQSEYRSPHSPVENNFGHFTFPKNLASMIRDSIELTKVKNQEFWVNNKIKRKECWFDGEQMKENNSKKHTEDHRLNKNRAPEVPRPDPNLTPLTSTGYRFAKQAWTDVGLQVRLQRAGAQEVSVPLNGLGGGSKSPQRKGTRFVQPQTAAEANQNARTQGKNRISHPASRRMTSEEKAMDPDCTPTEEQISQIWHNIRSALTSQHATTTMRTGAFDGEQVKRKPHLEQNRLHPDSGNKCFQRTLQAAQPVRLLPSGILPVKGLIVHKSKVYSDALEDSDFAAAVVRGRKHRPGMVAKPSNVLQGLSTISMEEHRVLLSLERLDQLLQCEHFDKVSGNILTSIYITAAHRLRT